MGNGPVIIRHGHDGKITRHDPHKCPSSGGLIEALVIAGLTVVIIEGSRALYRWWTKDDEESEAETINKLPQVNLKKSYAAKKGHLTRKAKYVVTTYKKLQKPRPLKEVERLLKDLLDQLQNLNEYAKQLNAEKVYLNIDEEAWAALIKMKREAENTCLGLKKILSQNQIKGFPRFKRPEFPESMHRTLQNLVLIQNQMYHALELASWCAENNLDVDTRLLEAPKV